MGNSLNSERTASEKLRALNATQKYRASKRRKAAGSYILIIAISLVAIILTVYSLMTREATTLFKLALVLEIIAALGMFITFCCCAGKAEDSLTWLCVILTLIHLVLSVVMVTRGRFKIDEVVTGKDGFVYDVIDGEYYLYDCGNRVSDIVVSELSWPIVGFSDGLKGNSNIKSITIDVPEFTVKNSAFAKCMNLTDITFGDGIYTIGGRAFYGCSRLESVVFNGGSYTFKGGSFFKKCDRLANIHMNNGVFITKNKLSKFLSGLGKVAVHQNNSTIGVTLDGADELTLVIYNGVTSIGKIKPDVLVLQEGFDFQTWVDSRRSGDIKPIAPVMYIPASVSNIPERFFGSNSKSATVYYQGDSSSWSYIDVEGTGGWIFGSNSNYSRDLLIVHYNADCKYWEMNIDW